MDDRAEPHRPTGLLTRMPPRALVTVGDFSTLLASSDRGRRDEVYALLRRAYDGHVVREMGNAPEPLVWEGRLTMLAAVTSEIDRYSAHSDALGPRWLYCRVPDISADGRRKATRLSRQVRRRLAELRADARELATRLVHDAAARLPDVEEAKTLMEWVHDAAEVASLGRAAVPRSGYGRKEIEGEAVREEPIRLAGQLSALNRALLSLGLGDRDAIQIVTRCALDSMPLTRRKVLAVLAVLDDEKLSTSEIARRANTDRGVARRCLEDLRVLGATEGGPEDEDDRAGRPWSLTGPDAPLTTEVFGRVGGVPNCRFLPSIPPPREEERPGGSLRFGTPSDPEAEGDSEAHRVSNDTDSAPSDGAPA